MSKGRMIFQQSERGTIGILQGGKLGFLAASLVLALSVLRPGFPTRMDWRAWTLIIDATLASLVALSFAYRQWPHRFSRLHRMAARFDPNRKLKVTRDGKILIGITIAVGAAAVNTGNNFLYLVLGLLLALVSVSGVLSEWVLRDIRVALEPGGERFATMPGLVAFHVFNLKQRIASMSVEVTPLVARPGSAVGSDPLRLTARFFMRLRPSARERGVIRTLLPARGVYRLLGFEVATAYPFGFFRKWKHEVPEGAEASELLAFPNPAPVAEQLRKIRMMVGERPGDRAGRGEEFFSLREHNAHDDIRKIAWKRSARTGRLMVREDEEPRGRVVTLVVAGGAQDPTAEQRERFEHACSVAAGLVLALLDRGDDVGVVAGAQVVEPGRGVTTRDALLTALALAHLNDETAQLPSGARHGAVVVVEGPGSQEPARVSLRVSSAHGMPHRVAA